MATDQELEQALRNADAAGRGDDATALATELRSRRAKAGQSTTDADPLGGVETGPTAPDPLANVPMKISGVTLPDSIRQDILAGRSISDPKEKRLAAARIAGRVAAMEGNEGGNAADRFASSRAGAALRGFGAGIFGVGDLAAAAGQAVGSELSFGEALEAQREFRRTLEERFPGTSLTGEIGGAISGGGVALKALGPVAKATVFSKGGGFKGAVTNIGKAMLAGGTAGGITEEITEGEGLQGLKVGALSGPLGLGLARAANVTARTVKNALQDPASKGIAALAKRLGETPDEMMERFQLFQAVTGKTPTITDISNPQAVAELRTLISETPTAVIAAREGAETLTRRRAGEVGEAITGSRQLGDEVSAKKARDVLAVADFALADNAEIKFTGDQVDGLLADPDLKGAIRGPLRRRLDEILDQPPNGGATLTGQDVNDLRIALRKRVGPGGDQVFKELADELEGVAREQSPEFAEAIDKFAQRSRQAEALTTGRKAVRSKETGAVQAAARRETDKAITPARAAGARSELVDVAQEGVTRAAKLSEDLAEESALVSRLRAVLPEAEVKQLQEIGRLQARAIANIEAVTPKVRSNLTKKTDDVVKDVADAAVAGHPLTFVTARARALSSLLGRHMPGMPDEAVEQIARDIFDPTKTKATLAQVREAGVNDADILSAFAASFGSGEIAANQ